MVKDLKAFGEKLAALRTTAGLSRQALLERLDRLHARVEVGPLSITPQLLWNWEKAYTYKGRSWTPQRQHLIYLIEAFADQLTPAEARAWAAQAGYTLGKTDLQAIFPPDDETRHRIGDLSWAQLRQICQDITHQRMATVQNKYHKTLYLPRRETRQAFERFLKSDKRCFVLTGKSGVGKSNFLLALSEDLQRSRDDLCVLMYDSIHFQVTPSITETIGQDFKYRLALDGQQPKEIWPEIGRIEQTAARQVILCVDALNEHPQAKKLLQQLDELVQSPWPWLKTIFSSRPETWQVIKRGVRLSEALYYRENEETLGVQLKPFSYSQQMEDFSQQELPKVYAKYQAIFELQTPYEALAHELREMLRDPLSLWLAAQTYKQQAIPDSLKRTELIEQYVNTLLKHEIIYRDDLKLLREKLVPLLVRGKDYSNALSMADIESAGEVLYEAIFSERLLRDGRRMNQSFTNLLDADILTRQQESRDEKIAFKYERFYEYFVGQHIFNLGEIKPDRPAFFMEIIDHTIRTPFLWGAVKNALLQETKVHGPETILKLCFTDQQRIKAMAVDVLFDFGQDERPAVEDILEKILPPQKTANRLQSLWKFLHKSYGKAPIRTRNAQKAAIEIASHLQLPQILETAALQLDTTIRITAARYIYRLWQNDPSMGFEIVERLAHKAVPGLIPHPTIFEVVFGLSLIILFDRPRDRMVLNRLQKIWQEVIAKLLGVKESSSRPGKWVRDLVREQVFDFAVRVTLKLLEGLPGHTVINAQDLEAFFCLGAEQKALYRRLTQYLDVHGDYSKEQMEQDFIAVLFIRNLLIEGVFLTGLVAHNIHSSLEFMPLLKKLVDEIKQDPVPSPYLSSICDALWTTSIQTPMPDEIFEFFVEMVELCQEYYTKHPKIPQLKRDHIYYGARAMYLGAYALHQHKRTGTVHSDWLETRIRSALIHDDLNFFEFLLKTELSILGVELGYPQLALDVLALFFDMPNTQIRSMIQLFLARLRTYYPNEVDDFLETQGAPREFQLYVQTNEPDEELSWLIGIRAWTFVEYELIAGPPTLRTSLIRLFARAADSKNVQKWISSGFRDVVNLLYGEEILRQTK